MQEKNEIKMKIPRPYLSREEKTEKFTGIPKSVFTAAAETARTCIDETP